MSDLTAGKHTIKIVLKSGTLNVDALNTIGERLAGADGAVTEILTELPTLEYYVTGSGVGDCPPRSRSSWPTAPPRRSLLSGTATPTHWMRTLTSPLPSAAP